MLIYSEKFNVECLVSDGLEARFRNLGFSKSDKDRDWKGSVCVSVFKGTKSDHIQAVIKSTDIEAFVRMGFVVNGERLPEKEIKAKKKEETKKEAA
jgi:hypothetical protein